jgi:hypothetical protein
VIPKEMPEALHWESGTQLPLVSGASGVTTKAIPKKNGLRLKDLIGMLEPDGTPVSTADLCRPVDNSAMREVSETRGR